MSMPDSSVKSRSASYFFSRYVLPLVLLVLSIGGIVWVQQHLRQAAKATPPPPPSSAKPYLVFLHQFAQWDKTDKKTTTKDEKKNKTADINFKEFEVDTTGHYDFLFHNVSDEEIEVGLVKTGCACTSVEIGVLSEAEWQYAKGVQENAPGIPIHYRKEPAWQELSADPQKKPFVLKPKEPGIIRARWKTAGKQPDQPLELSPKIWTKPVQGSLIQGYAFGIGGTMTHPIRLYPQRIHVGVLQPSGTVKAEFYVWSPTRDAIDLKFTSGPTPDPLLDIEIRQITREACEKYLLALNTDKKDNDKLTTRVLTAYRVTVTVHEQKGNHQMEQGVFHRKLYTHLDGLHNDQWPAPEIVGQVAGYGTGDVKIGGADDRGRIRFKPFDAKIGETKMVELSTDAKVTLERFTEVPAGLDVDVTLDKKNSNSERNYWRLKVTVPPNTFCGSFSEIHAVKLRILEKGQPDRFIRIPLEGHAG